VPVDRDTAVRLLISRRSRLLGYIYSIVRDWGEADDVFQEVSLLVLKKCRAIRDVEHFGGWVRSVARLEAISVLRKRGRGPELLGDAVLDLLDFAWDEDEAKLLSGQLESLRSCMEKLTERARRILHFRYVEGIKGEALAEILQQPPNTIYVALSRIHQQLANCIEQRIADEDARDGSASRNGQEDGLFSSERPLLHEDTP
jgi:RNA polymerase sigma-70 factor, ECF subfamily